MQTNEKIVLENLVFNDDYAKKISSFVKQDYFEDNNEKRVFLHIVEYIQQYNSRPTTQALEIAVNSRTDLNDSDHDECIAIINALEDKKNDEKWLLETTENWAKERALFNAIRKSIDIMENNVKNTKKDAIPDLVRDALSISLDNSVGHEYLNDWELRYDLYHKKENKIPTGLKYFDMITQGGFSNKTLNIFLGGVGGGKTLTKCHLAASMLEQGYNVLYITMEMAEERIAERIDANLMDVDVDSLSGISKTQFDSGIGSIKAKTKGELYIKEYGTGTAHVGHFRYLIRELEIKKKFKPDVIFIDYLNICCSNKLPASALGNSYLYVKVVAEEIRAMAKEFDIPIISSSQFNRTGYGSSDPDLTDTSESFGLPATADIMIGIVSTDQLQVLKQYMFKQLKNRYSDPAIHNKFVVGYNKARMKLFDVSVSAQQALQQPQFPKEPPPAVPPPNVMSPSFKKSKFSGFKV